VEVPLAKDVSQNATSSRTCRPLLQHLSTLSQADAAHLGAQL